MFVVTVKRILDRDDGLLKHGAVMFVAGVGSNVLNYVYQLLMGRMLGPVEYGTFGALMAVAYILTVPVQTIQTATAKQVCSLQALDRHQDVASAVRRTLVRVATVGLFALIIVVPFCQPMARFLKVDGSLPVAVLMVAAYLMLLAPALNGTLMGLQRFTRLATTQVAGAVGKLSLAILLVVLGWGVSGALGGLVVGAILSLLLGTWFLRDIWKKDRPTSIHPLPGMARDSAVSLCSFLCVTLFYNVDILFVKRLFLPNVAGDYVAASTLSKAIFFGSISIASAMFPKVSAKLAAGENPEARRLLQRTLLYTASLAACGVALLTAVSPLAIRALFGESYAASADVLRWMSGGMFFLALVYVLALHGIAQRNIKTVLLLIFAAIAEAAAIVLFHESIRIVSMVFASSMLVLSIALVIQAFRPAARSTPPREAP